jgi:hypothetical protein
VRRLPPVRTLAQVLPKGAEGGKEFSRVVNLLLFFDARRRNRPVTLLDDAAGDFAGLDALQKDGAVLVGYQYKFYPSPLTNAQRAEVKKSLEDALAKRATSGVGRWVLVLPTDLTESARRKDGGDVKWFEGLKKLGAAQRVEVGRWGHTDLLGLFLETPSLCLRYYPELAPGGAERRRTVEETRRLYDANFDKAHRPVRFVGISVYEEAAARVVKMERIYVPLRLVPEGEDDESSANRTDPLTLLRPGARHVILGDPGSGKSTLLRFLALAGQTPELQQRYGAAAEPDRLPVFLSLGRYADELKADRNLSLLDYLVRVTRADFNLPAADLAFFEYYLDRGQALLCFDGLDELPNPQFKALVRDRVRSLLTSYPGNVALVTSRPVGYDAAVRFDGQEFRHHKIARLGDGEIKRFVADWYAEREPDERLRKASVENLVGALESSEHRAIRDLARNPLLLTIIALVHRVGRHLPDARGELYERCTDTLLNTWEQWRSGRTDGAAWKSSARANRQRLEAVAAWMQGRSVAEKKGERAVVPRRELVDFLTRHIETRERLAPSAPAPEELADNFVEFVKQRAGLLVEVGDGQFSFVHLTFQEYLTACHLYTVAERNLSVELWNNVADKTDSDRWQETLRLLTALLRSRESRANLVGQLLEQCEQGRTAARVRLLLGLLSDSVEEAEEEMGRVVALALQEIAALHFRPAFQNLLDRLRSVQRKNAAAGAAVADQAGALARAQRAPEKRGALILTAVAAGVPGPEALSALPRSPRPSVGDLWLRALLTPGRTPPAEELLHELERFRALCVDLLFRRESGVLLDGVFLAVAGSGLAFLLGAPYGERFAFRFLLTGLWPVGGSRAGPETTPGFYFFGDIMLFFALSPQAGGLFVKTLQRKQDRPGMVSTRRSAVLGYALVGLPAFRLQAAQGPPRPAARASGQVTDAAAALPRALDAGLRGPWPPTGVGDLEARLRDVWSWPAREALARALVVSLGLTPEGHWEEVLLRRVFAPHGSPLPRLRCGPTEPGRGRRGHRRDRRPRRVPAAVGRLAVAVRHLVIPRRKHLPPAGRRRPLVPPGGPPLRRLPARPRLRGRGPRERPARHVRAPRPGTARAADGHLLAPAAVARLLPPSRQARVGKRGHANCSSSSGSGGR